MVQFCTVSLKGYVSFPVISCEIEPYTLRYEFEHKDGILTKHVRYSFASMIY